MHHLHQRKRANLKKDPYPHPHKWTRYLDHVVLLCGIIGPLMTLPQIFKIYNAHDVSGISAITWLLYAILDVPWIIYGIVHRTKPIIIAYCGWFTVNMAVVIGVLFYTNNGLF